MPGSSCRDTWLITCPNPSFHGHERTACTRPRGSSKTDFGRVMKHRLPATGISWLLGSFPDSRSTESHIAIPFLWRIFRNLSFRPALSVVYSLVMIALVCFGRDVAEAPSANTQTFQAGGLSFPIPGAAWFGNSTDFSQHSMKLPSRVMTAGLMGKRSRPSIQPTLQFTGSGLSPLSQPMGYPLLQP